MTFHDLNLNKQILSALDEAGYEFPTPIQKEAFSIIMSGKDVVGLAQTGTGKTLAYLLPLLRMYKFAKDNHPRTLIIVPTRELVVQIVTELERLTTYLSIRVVGVYGGTNINTQKHQVGEGADLIIGTPGRLFDLAMTGVLKLKNIRKLVIDEVDQLLDLGFKHQLDNIIDLLPKRRQNIMFSATLSPATEKLINENFNHPELIEIAPHGTPIERIDQQLYEVPNFFTKINLLVYLLDSQPEMEKVLIFSASKKLADKLWNELPEHLASQCMAVHSNKSQNFRLNAVKSFHNGELRGLITTDLMARGMDILDVTHVVNMDIPEDPATYIHRIGRTGRAQKDGSAITLLSEYERDRWEAIEDLMNKHLEPIEIPAAVEISEEELPFEVPQIGGKFFLTKAPNLSKSQGAFHKKKDKNLKVNRAKEKRQARMLEKKKSRRRGPKKR